MKRLAALALVVAAFSARAAVTNDVDVTALLAAADNSAMTTTNGWTLFHIGLYSDPVLQFNSKDDWIVSKDFGSPILRMEFSVRCTENTVRRLAIVNESTGEQLREFSLCAAGNKDEPQTFDFALEEKVTRFRLKMNTHDATTGYWGVRAMKVIVAESAVAPSDIRVARKGDDWCALSWVNVAGTVSNRVDTYKVERGAGEEVVYATDFDGFEGNSTSAKNLSDKLQELLGESFSGVRVYGARNTNGICQTGTADELGILRYSGLADYSGIWLRMSARRLSGCQPQTIVASELDGSTNVVHTLTLTDDFTDYSLDLSSVDGGSAILIGYWATKSNRSIQIDSLSIVRTGIDVPIPIDTRWLPASPGLTRFSTQGQVDLAPKSEYRFEVCAQNADGLVSEGAVVGTVLDSTSGFRFILQ